MNKIYKNVMPDPRPARATIQTAALVNNARIEISANRRKTKIGQIANLRLAGPPRDEASRLRA